MLRFADKLFPNQPEQLKRFQGSIRTVASRVDRLCAAQTILPKFDIDWGIYKDDPAAMASPPAVLSLLSFLVGMTKPHTILEIGSFVGLSALTMSAAQSNDGRLVTLEKDAAAADLARKNISEAGYAARVIVVKGDALEYLRCFASLKYNPFAFDFVFIDGAKEHYADYLMLLAPRLCRDALVVMDDCFFNGDTLNDGGPMTDKGRGVRNALDYIARSRDWDQVLLPMCNGVLLLRKK